MLCNADTFFVSTGALLAFGLYVIVTYIRDVSMLKSGKFIEEDMRAYDMFWGKMKVELEKKSMMGKGSAAVTPLSGLGILDGHVREWDVWMREVAGVVVEKEEKE